jgi:hypothetical protein
MRSLPAFVAIAIVSLSAPTITSAAPPCPPEVKEARELLTAKTATAAKVTRPPKSQAGARGQEVQTARGQDAQTARGQDAQTARGQDAQTARGQDAQTARGQDAQTARGQDAQTARGQDVQAPRNAAKGRAAAFANARKLVTAAETSCRDADDQRASANARAAMELLKYLP